MSSPISDKKNVFVIVTKTVNGKFDLMINDERLHIYSARLDAEKYLRDKKHNVHFSVTAKRWTIRKINLTNLIKLIA